MLQSIEANLINLNTVVRSMYGSMIEFRAEVKSDINSLREDLNVLNDSMSNLSMCLQEHKKQTETELADLHTSLVSTQVNLNSHLAQLQTSFNSTHSKVDSLTATTAQLSSDHQQILHMGCLNTKLSFELHQTCRTTSHTNFNKTSRYAQLFQYQLIPFQPVAQLNFHSHLK